MVLQAAGASAAGDEPEATSLLGATAHLRLRAPVRLVVLAAKDLPALAGLRKNLPGNVELLGVGRNLEELALSDEALATATVAYNLLMPHPSTRDDIRAVWRKLKSVAWLHTASVGQEHILFPELVQSPAPLTNSRGVYSAALGEWALAAANWFAKDLPRLRAQQKEKKWEQYKVEELRRKTFGVIGYGDIGQAAARLARAYGMRVVALRRRTQLTADEVKEGLVEKVYSPDQVKELAAESDYVLISTPWTPATDKILSKEAIAALKPNAVVINVGRGKCIDEEALIDALRDKRIRGAALDVFATEPLPQDNLLWDLDNVLVSPHSADHTKDFMDETVQVFLEQLDRFIAGQELLHVVDKCAGY